MFSVTAYTAVKNWKRQLISFASINSNFLLLELIKAYDQTKQSEYLEEATRLAEWLKNANCLEGLSTINYLQCIARQSELSSEQE